MTLCAAAKQLMHELENSPPALFAGQIKKGEPKGQGFPKDTDHFRLHPAQGYEFATQLFAEAFGAEPRSFKAELPFDTIEQNLKGPFTLYDTANNLLRLCDGESVLKERTNHREFLTEYDPGQKTCCMLGKKPYEKAECKAGLDAELLIRIPDLHIDGLFRVKTGAWHDVREIMKGLISIQHALRDANMDESLRNVPIVVSRQLVQATRQKRVKQNGEIVATGERVQKDEWWINVAIDPEFFSKLSFMIQSQKRIAMIQAVAERKRLMSQLGVSADFVESNASRMLGSSTSPIVVEVEDELEVEYEPAPAPAPAAKSKPAVPKPAPAATPAVRDDEPPMPEDPGTSSEPATPLATSGAIKWLDGAIKKMKQADHFQKTIEMFMEEGKDESKVKFWRKLVQDYDEFDVQMMVVGLFRQKAKELEFDESIVLAGLPGIPKTQETKVIETVEGEVLEVEFD